MGSGSNLVASVKPVRLGVHVNLGEIAPLPISACPDCRCTNLTALLRRYGIPEMWLGARFGPGAPGSVQKRSVTSGNHDCRGRAVVLLPCP